MCGAAGKTGGSSCGAIAESFMWGAWDGFQKVWLNDCLVAISLTTGRSVCVCVHIACLRSCISFRVSALHNREMDPRSPYFSYMPLHYSHIVFYILKIKKACKDGQKTSRDFDGRQKQTWSWTRWCGINKSTWNPLDLNAKKVTSAKENARRPLFYIKTHWHCIPLQMLWQVVKFSDEQFSQRDILQGQTKKGHPHKRS